MQLGQPRIQHQDRERDIIQPGELRIRRQGREPHIRQMGGPRTQRLDMEAYINQHQCPRTQQLGRRNQTSITPQGAELETQTQRLKRAPPGTTNLRVNREQRTSKEKSVVRDLRSSPGRNDILGAGQVTMSGRRREGMAKILRRIHTDLSGHQGVNRNASESHHGQKGVRVLNRSRSRSRIQDRDQVRNMSMLRNRRRTQALKMANGALHCHQDMAQDQTMSQDRRGDRRLNNLHRRRIFARAPDLRQRTSRNGSRLSTSSYGYPTSQRWKPSLSLRLGAVVFLPAQRNSPNKGESSMLARAISSTCLKDTTTSRRIGRSGTLRNHTPVLLRLDQGIWILSARR